MIRTSDLMREYAAAARSAYMDGKDVAGFLSFVAYLIDEGRFELTDREGQNIRCTAGICAAGGGHWKDECDSRCGGTDVERELFETRGDGWL